MRIIREVRLLNYLPRWGDGHWVDNGIDGWTWVWNSNVPEELRCSHSEVWTDDNDVFEEENRFWGTCSTSTMRGEVDGVVSRPAGAILKNRDRWTYFKIKVFEEDYKDLMCRISQDVLNNTGYGKVTILSFFWPWRFGKKPICSGQCHRWLQDSCFSIRLFNRLKKLKSPSPIRLASRVWLAGHDLYSLETNEIILEKP